MSLAWPSYLGVDKESGSGVVYKSTEDGAITVEAGASYFYIGDYVYETAGFQKLSNRSGVTYTSQNKAVATVSKTTGAVKVKKAGEAVLNIRYKGKTTTCTLKAVAKGKLGSSNRGYSTLQKRAQAAAKAYGTGLNSRNCYEVNNQLVQLENALPTDKKTVNSKGFLYAKGVLSNKLIVSALGRYEVMQQAMHVFAEKVNPIGTRADAAFAIKSVSGKGKQITIRLKKNVTASQIFGIKKNAGWDSELNQTATAQFPIYVKDRAKGYQYYATATATKGSSQITVQLYTKNLTKNHSYRLIGAKTGSGKMAYGWTLGKTFQAK